MTPALDLLIKRVRVVRPRQADVPTLDVGVKDGRFARIAPDIPAGEAAGVGLVSLRLRANHRQEALAEGLRLPLAHALDLQQRGA